MSIFKSGCFYRRSDLVGNAGQLFRNNRALDRAIEIEGLSPGRMVNRIRTWTGDELNEFWETRSKEKIALPEGFGHGQHGGGRKPRDRHA